MKPRSHRTGGFAVLDLGREDGMLAEAIIDAGDGVALGEEGDSRATILAAAFPGAAVDPDNERGIAIVPGWQVEIEFLALVPVFDVGQVTKRLCARGQSFAGQEPQAPTRGQQRVGLPEVGSGGSSSTIWMSS